MRAVLIGVLSAGLLLSACTATTPGKLTGPATDGGPTGQAPVDPEAELPTPPESTISWNDCTDLIVPQLAGEEGADRPLKFDCGFTDVPKDYADPEGDTVELLVVKVTLVGQTNRIGSLMVNPGGPGGSGANLAIGLALTLPMDILQHFDIVGFDPRGVGGSTPVECISVEEKDAMAAAPPDPTTKAEIDEFVTGIKDMAKGCYDQYDGLEHINTVEAARDMEQLRQALGDEKLTYLGYSYGTLLGSVYADLYPDKVRALVLDGAVDPQADEISSNETQTAGFEDAFNQFAADCTAQGTTACPAGPDPRQRVEELLDKSAADPIASSDPDETRKATAGHVMTAVISALYDKESWPVLATALADASNGDAKGILTLADQYNERFVDENGQVTYSNITDVNITINCTDTAETHSIDEVSSLAEEWRTKYPLFGGSSVWSMYTCSEWKTRRHPLPTIDANGAVPIMVIGTEHDPATPYKSAQVLTDLRDSGFLVTWQGDGHTAYPKTDCITQAVDAYLIDLTVPPDDVTCPAA